mmetsp:Transcript_13973/g.30342  ORF Transcript_13973/g.30342 Transcript_13973/m.30342 type:complete len:591 (-) Transcript_13973:252-2024(-)|eukprot:CAMPEP_0172534578 /NCGR_PEP_ID=MMETSP1067-20121228/6886_1 /TAXON_ID=265564 ORGANISM="Thalassiosira punctigera, Strain Tpunct2005C2" /NCGR_SAMPLE_ID=MMETSP1067 /ASSEMBLY_ACC=CAM_ASM_000444 /LENGTH=590 /DNA_ID=CAMNT_0013319387 /DNA_START=121 /DNA_END=1893 /DNA_ORIENTATION=+
MEELRVANNRLTTVCNDYERDFKSQIAELDDEESAIMGRLDELNQKKLEIARANGDVGAADEDFIEVNAGGEIVAAKRSTLTRFRGTRMEALFSGRWDRKLQQDSRGRIFLDINPACFRAIVDYLHEVAISSEDNPPDPPRVEDEHKRILHYQLKMFGLLDRVPGEMPASNIVKSVKEVTRLHEWLGEDDADGEFSLLYCSSRDGLSDATFHSNCDFRGCTLTVIRTTNGYVLGGYSSAPWRNSGAWTTARKSFLFLLSGGDVSSPCKMRAKGNNVKPVYCSAYGPGFGSSSVGCDLIVQGSTLRLQFGNAYESVTSSCRLTGGYNNPFAIEEMEVFQVTGESSWAQHCQTKEKKIHPTIMKYDRVTRFSVDINEAINDKQESLLLFRSELLNFQESFLDECRFVKMIAGGAEDDLVTLNVGGTIMVTERSTLCTAEDSVLAQQFDDSKWTEQGCNNLCVAEWTPDDVSAWIEKIEGVPSDVSKIFEENEITGRELLALGIAGLKLLGIRRSGTVCLLLQEMEKLQNVALIEHSPYCFGKILDYLRLKRLCSQGLMDEPTTPTVCKLQRSRFEKVVNYYFPGESAKFILE